MPHFPIWNGTANAKQREKRNSSSKYKHCSKGSTETLDLALPSNFSVTGMPIPIRV